MAESTAAAAPVTQEAVGSVPEKGNQPTYEQITDQLKATMTDQAEETPDETTAAPEQTSDKPTEPSKAEADEFRTMTDQEIAALPPELQQEAKALRKRFQAAYTKKTMDLAEIRRKAEFVDRFDTDPEFRRQVLQQAGGLEPRPAQTTQATDPPPGILKMVQEALPPEMQWLAPAQAQIAWKLAQAMQQHLVQPLQQNVTRLQQEKREQEYSQVLGEFAGRNPGWEAHEDAMVEVLEFLKGPALTHPRFGSKHDLLYRLAQGPETVERKAVETVLERTNRALKSRSITGTGASRGTESNLEDRIRDRKLTDDQAWDLIKRQHGGGA